MGDANVPQVVQTLSSTLGVAWASGLNLYAAILVVGLLGATDAAVLPENLQILTHPLVLCAAGLMYMVEFFADKTPGVDSVWDAMHTFIRVPAGAVLAASMAGMDNPALTVAAGLVGGTVAASSHATKAGTRVLINTSPEPFTNWGASVTEDIAAVGALFLALNYPWLFLILLLAFLGLVVWLLPKLWRAIKTLFLAATRFFRKNTLQSGNGACRRTDAIDLQ